MIKTEIINELNRRCNILIENSKKDDVFTGMSGSLIRFTMALAPVGYPSQAEPWMDKEYTKSIMTEEEFASNTYDSHIKYLFKIAYDKVNNKD
jgi:hypothetical protein